MLFGCDARIPLAMHVGPEYWFTRVLNHLINGFKVFLKCVDWCLQEYRNWFYWALGLIGFCEGFILLMVSGPFFRSFISH